MKVEGRVGIIASSEGTVNPLTTDTEGALRVASASHGARYEAAANGKIYSLVQTAWTTNIAAGHLLAGTAAANVQFILWNPIDSGVNISLLKFSVNITSGTSPISGMWHAVGSTAPTIATGTLAAGSYINSHYAGTATYDGVAGYYTHVTGGAATGASIARVVRSTGISQTAGTYAALGGILLFDNLDGDIVLPPNSFWVPQWAAAGTSMLGGYSITWEEIDV
jgi:hypothetical protein